MRELERIAIRADGYARYLVHKDSGQVPCSRYGWDSRSCAPTAAALAIIIEYATGDPVTVESLEYCMGLVVNDHDDPEDIIDAHGAVYGFTNEELWRQ